jgi:hypothetical protein
MSTEKTKKDMAVYIAIVALSAIIFVVDAFTPLGSIRCRQ